MELAQKNQLLSDWKELKSTRLVGQKHKISRTTVSKVLRQFPEYKKELANTSLIDKLREMALEARSMNHLACLMGMTYSKTKRLCEKNGVQIERKLISEPLKDEFYGYWKILYELGYKQTDESFDPNVKPEKNSIFFVKARCIRCDTQHNVNKSNLIQGKTHQCNNCKYKDR